MATMHDVARLAQGSRSSTVSYVLTGTRPISEATRDAGARSDGRARLPAERDGPRSGQPAEPDPRPLLPMEQRGLGATETAFVTGAAARGQRCRLPPGALARVGARTRRAAAARQRSGCSTALC